MTQRDDHGTLPAHAEQLLSRVEDLHGLSVHADAVRAALDQESATGCELLPSF